MRGNVDADDAATTAVVDDDLLAEAWRDVLGHQSPNAVHAAARCIWNDQSHRLRWISSFGCGCVRGMQHCGSQRCESEAVQSSACAAIDSFNDVQALPLGGYSLPNNSIMLHRCQLIAEEFLHSLDPQRSLVQSREASLAYVRL